MPKEARLVRIVDEQGASAWFESAWFESASPEDGRTHGWMQQQCRRRYHLSLPRPPVDDDLIRVPVTTTYGAAD